MDEICDICGRWISPVHNTCGCTDEPDLEAIYSGGWMDWPDCEHDHLDQDGYCIQCSVYIGLPENYV